MRGGRPTRGFPPGSAQALVAVVLGVVLGVAGVHRHEVALGLLFFAVAACGTVALARLFLRR